MIEVIFTIKSMSYLCLLFSLLNLISKEISGDPIPEKNAVSLLPPSCKSLKMLRLFHEIYVVKYELDVFKNINTFGYVPGYFTEMIFDKHVRSFKYHNFLQHPKILIVIEIGKLKEGFLSGLSPLSSSKTLRSFP